MARISPLPCPFCGSKDIGVKNQIVDLDFKQGNLILLYAYCRYCNANGKMLSIHSPANDDILTDIAYEESWNIRVK